MQYHCSIIFFCIPVSPFIVDGAVCFTHNRETTINFIDIMKFNSKCTSGLASFSGQVKLIIYCIVDKVRQNCQGDPPAQSENKNVPPCVLNCFSEEVYVQLDPHLVPVLVNSLKDSHL